MRKNWLHAAVAAAIAAVVALPAIRAEEKPAPPTREEYRNATNALKQMGLAFHNYHDANNALPGNVPDKDGKPMLSWRVLILPYIEEDALYREFKLDEPWDSDTNKKLIAKMPKLYAPARGKAKAGETYYQMFTGPGTLLDPKKRFTIANVTDGLSNTGMVFEAGDPVTWTKPDDILFDAKNQLPRLGGPFDGECHVVLCDGAVKLLKKDPDEKELKKLIQPADGEVIDLDKLTK
jgi:hypothetical protein